MGSLPSIPEQNDLSFQSSGIGDVKKRLANQFGGASSAFSLRDIGAKNKPVVRVRRQPYDTTSTIDDETDFKASEVKSRALENWVNGKLETTLPGDLSAAKTLQSLRKVRAGYTGDVLRIRRETDNIEVNVGFDSNDKVSNSSPITDVENVDGETGNTNVTTLGNFLTETTNVEKSYDHSADPSTTQSVYVNVGKYGTSSPTTYDGNSNPDNLPTIPSGSRYATKWTSTNASYGFSYGNEYNGSTYSIEFDVLQKAGTQNIRFANTNTMEAYPQSNVVEGSLETVDGISNQFTTKDTWVHFKMTFRTGIKNNGKALIRSSDTSVQTTWYIANLKVTPTVDSNAFVHTWYNQARDLSVLQTYFDTPLDSSFAVTLADEEVGTYFGRSDTVKITTTEGNGQRYHQKDYGIGANSQVRFQAEIYIPSTNSLLDSFAYSEKFDVSGNARKHTLKPQQDQWVDIDISYLQEDDTSQRLIFWSSSSATPTANYNVTGDVVYFRNVRVTRVVNSSVGTKQDSAPRQPQIAENGTLLDHLKFDGSGTVTTPTTTDQYLVDTEIAFSNALTIACVSDRLSDSSAGMYPVSVSRQDAVNRYFGIQESTNVSTFITRNSTYRGHTVTNNSATKRFTIGRVGYNSDTDAKISIFGRPYGNNDGGDWGNTVGVTYQNSYVIGALGLANDTGSVATNTATFRGRIYETFAYSSDEEDKLFKMASNVNNYHNLYDDENSFSANAQVDGTGSTVSNASKEGGTLTLNSASGNNYLYFQLNETVTASSSAVDAGGDVYISFEYESSDESVALTNVKLRDDSDNAQSGDLVSQNGTTITVDENGFYSGRLASANLTDTGTRLAFLTTQTTNGYTFTIKNLRYSRTERNGYVQTWYDQRFSSNATNNVASNQPYIVAHGGLITNKGGRAAIAFTRNSVEADERRSVLNFTGPNVDDTSVFAVNEQIRNFSNIIVYNEGSSTFRVRFGRYNQSGVGRRVELEVTNSGESATHVHGSTNLNTLPAYGLYLGYLKSGGNSRVGFNTVTTTSASLTLPGGNDYKWNEIFRGDIVSGDLETGYQKIPEIIIYQGDKLDNTTIINNIKDYYNI